MSALPLEVLRECLAYLPYRDLLQCRQVNVALGDTIRHSSQLQLRLHLGENGIQPEREGSKDPERELSRLQKIEERLSKVQFGSSFSQSETFQISVANARYMNLIAIADDDVYLPISIRGEEGFRGITRYPLRDQGAPPEELNFGQLIRHFQVEQAEGCIMVVFLQGHQSIAHGPLALSVMRYALPELPNGYTYVTGQFECSPVSLSGRRKDRGTHHLLEDGAGIFIITLEVQQWSSQEADLAGDSSSDDVHVDWELMTAVTRIDRFHKTAKKALSDMHSLETTMLFLFSSWAPTELSWLPLHTFSPSSDSICGYRLAMTEEIQMGCTAHSENGNQDVKQEYKKVSIYDFSTAHASKVLATAKFDNEEVTGSDIQQALGHLLRDEGYEERAVESLNWTLVKQSRPSVSTSFLSEALEVYVAKTPYTVSTRNVRISPPALPSVLHLTQEYLLFAQSKEQGSWNFQHPLKFALETRLTVYNSRPVRYDSPSCVSNHANVYPTCSGGSIAIMTNHDSGLSAGYRSGGPVALGKEEAFLPAPFLQRDKRLAAIESLPHVAKEQTLDDAEISDGGSSPAVQRPSALSKDMEATDQSHFTSTMVRVSSPRFACESNALKAELAGELPHSVKKNNIQLPPAQGSPVKALIQDRVICTGRSRRLVLV
ncbi:hypothetical protein NliqN6_2359 [Naganishia liquefaciens]|uniref:F-box domain-containing protein n=1 Tax=Naganishia liquefaciens TaxID=104408 RepID=A0A8H3TRP5_9TREE|nr:hypothetical protein NliqN6_2359 [Naganishia liquefaciens]